MTQKELTYDDLHITADDLYEQMGYHERQPDEATIRETREILKEVRQFLRPRFCFIVVYGTLDLEHHQLTVQDTTFDLGRIIARQLRGSEAFAFFVTTCGVEFEQYQQQLKQEGDLLRVFIADSLGSIIAERCADEMERFLQLSIDKLQWKHTNRFSPGYCEWHVSQQQKLFPLFGEKEPCGIHLTDSSLMIPIKSVSGIVGVGEHVRRLDYTCGLCDLKNCFKRKSKLSK